MTIPTRAVLGALLDAEGEVFGLEIVRTSGLGAGTIYPILQRLQAAGWVTARWEPAEHAHAEGRPPRRYYQLTRLGQARAVNISGSSTPQRPTLARLLDAVDPTPRLRPLEGT